MFKLAPLQAFAQPGLQPGREDHSRLPAPWKHQDIGSVIIPGHTAYDGRQFIIEGAGNATVGTADQIQFVYFPLETEGEITARFLPQPNSQFSKMGLMMRETLEAKSAQASLMLNPGKSAQAEAPQWEPLLISRPATGMHSQVKNTGSVLVEPVGEYWLRLRRTFNSFTAFTSEDGKAWTTLGSTFVEMKKKFFAGIAVSSGLKKKTSRATFDNVSIPGWKSGE